MTAMAQGVEVGSDQLGSGPGGLDWNRVRISMEHQTRDARERRQSGSQVIIAETGPDFLLGAAGDAEGRQIVRTARVEEVGRNRKLEDALLKGIRVALAETAFPQALSLVLKDR